MLPAPPRRRKQNAQDVPGQKMVHPHAQNAPGRAEDSGRSSERTTRDTSLVSIDEKAAALLDSLVRNHPLVDGNKRLGWLATLVLLDINGHGIEAPDDDAYQLVIAVAAGELSLEEIALALSQWRCEPG